jgi:membrane protein YdbS with pleckstrin-like domain
VPNTDPYRLTSADTTPSTTTVSRGEVARALLWILVVISAVANMAASYGDANTWIHLACGVVTVLCGGTLVVRNLRGRR